MSNHDQSNHDQLHRYLFANHAVRGELVSVNETYQQVLANHDYPPAVQKLLGEMLVATSLLTATLKLTVISRCNCRAARARYHWR